MEDGYRSRESLLREAVRTDESCRDAENEGINTGEPGGAKGQSVAVAGNWKKMLGKNSTVLIRVKSLRHLRVFCFCLFFKIEIKN